MKFGWKFFLGIAAFYAIVDFVYFRLSGEIKINSTLENLPSK